MEESLTKNAQPQGSRNSTPQDQYHDQTKPQNNVRVVFPQTGFFVQLWSSIIRFTLQQIRDPLSVALQILLPVIIVGAMAGVSTLSPSETQPAAAVRKRSVYCKSKV